MGVEERTAAATRAPEQVTRVRHRRLAELRDWDRGSCPCHWGGGPGAEVDGGLLLGFDTCLSSSAGSVLLSGIRPNSLVELVPGLWFPGLWVRLVPTKKAVIVETSIQSTPLMPPPRLTRAEREDWSRF